MRCDAVAPADPKRRSDRNGRQCAYLNRQRKPTLIRRFIVDSNSNMRPTASVIFFTTLFNAGHGILAWLGLALLAFADTSQVTPAMRVLTLWSAGVGLALAICGLLGTPTRPSGSMLPWRHSSVHASHTWWRHERPLASATGLATLILLGLAWYGPHPAVQSWMLLAAALAMAACALATLHAAGVTSARLPALPARTANALPVLPVLFALGTGSAFLLTLTSHALDLPFGDRLAWILLGQGLLLAIVAWTYWRDFDRLRPPAAPRAGVDPLRILVVALLLGGPLLGGLLALAGIGSSAALTIAAALMLGGAFVERWLFFTQTVPSVA